MPIFEIRNSKLTPIATKHINLEKSLQTLTEKNLHAIFGLEFVSGSLNQEFCIRTAQQEFYIDTLAFDPATKSFVIIEYKKDKSFSVIDQGYAYLAAMLSNKADFILEYIERKKATQKPNIDWRQSRILFVSTEFTNYQQSAIAFQDLPIQLWRTTLYANNTIRYEQIKAPGARGSIREIAPGRSPSPKVANEIRPYTLEEMFGRHKTSQEIRDLFKRIMAEIPSFADDFDQAFGKWSVIYRKQYKTFAYLNPRSREVYGELRLEDIKTSSRIGFKRQVQDKEVFKVAFRASSDDDIPDVLGLIKEAYENLSSDLSA